MSEKKFLGFIILVTTCLLVFAVPHSFVSADTGTELAQQTKNVCFNNCVSQNGASNKASCALQCGLAKAPDTSGAGPAQKDCGTIYKQCRVACGKDKACKKECRAARTQCY